MARYGQEHKDETRKRIIQAAGRRLKQDGINRSGIATLMADAGLTNGAFYAHFASKDDLVASVIEEELRLQAQTFGALPDGPAGIEQLVRAYLSQEHRDHRDLGCASAALLDEIGRSTHAAKEAYTAGTQALVEAIALHLDPDDRDDPETAHGRALILFTMIVGTLQVSRAVADRQVADEMLAQGVRHALAFLGIEQDG